MKMLRVVAILVVALALTLPAHAQGSSPPRGNISGFGAFTVSASDGLDGGNGFGVSGAVFFSRFLGVEGGYRRLSFDVIGDEATNTLAGGSLDANIVTLNAIVRVPGGSVQPFVTGGVAFLSGDYATDPTIVQQLAEFNFSPAESFESTVGFNVGGGVDFQVSRSIGIFAEGRFIAATADTVGGLTDDITGVTATTDGEQEMNLFTVAAGIRIFF